jgi:hypothetical protein
MRSLDGAMLAFLLMPALVGAEMNVTDLVPAYAPCPGGRSSCTPVKESSFSFDRALLKSPRGSFIGPNKVSLVVELRGVRDASGALVTTSTGDAADDFVVVIPPGRTVLVEQGLQLEPSSPLVPQTSFRIDLKNGKGRTAYKTPPETPTSGLVSEATTTPVVMDNQGKRFAVSGARSRD